MIGDAESIAEGYAELNARLAREREEQPLQREAARVLHRSPRRQRAFDGVDPPRTYKSSAYGDDLGRFARITTTLAKTDFKLHYEGSVLGFLWSVMKPLMLFGVIYAVFSSIIDVGAIDHYALYVLSSVVLWTYFSEATGKGVGSLVKHKNLLRKMRFPALAIPVSVSLQGLFHLGVNALVVVGFALATGVSPRLSWLEMPLLLALLAALTTGVVLLLSSLYVRYRDMEHIWRVAERVLFFGSPIIYAATQYPEEIRELAAMTPLVMILSEMRHAFIDAGAPSAAELVGGTPFLLVPIAITAAILAAGLLMFHRQAPRVAERL